MYLPTLTSFLAASSSLPGGHFLNSSTATVATLTTKTTIPRSASSSSPCSAGAAIVCNGPSKFGLCSSAGTVVFQDVAPGTICQCLGSQCNIVAGDAGKQANHASSQAVVTSSMSSAGATYAASSSAPPAGSSVAASSSAPPAAGSSSVAAAPTQSSSAAPSASAARSSSGLPSSSSGSYTYKTFTGNGSPAAGWPSESQWLSFDALWTANQNIIKTGCAAFSVPNNTPEEIADIKAALLSESQATGVDSRFALAIMMQESLGCVKVPTTSNSISNPGLFQDHAGSGTCYNKPSCPKSEIVQMVKDGLAGTSSGPGLQQLIQKAPASGSQGMFQAARLYNSGSADFANLNDGITSTACYVMDVANRLLGWNAGTSGCTL